MSKLIKICALNDIRPLGSRIVELPGISAGPVAIFRTADNDVFAVEDRCPHKQGPLSQGIVHGKSVTCPLHNWVIGLENGEAAAPDVGCAKSYAVKIQDDDVYLEAAVDETQQVAVNE
tara:strand:+ start:1478 stop:1831 length:354 start_codon:yes stop_codon:yes gene_type:complete